MYSRELLEESDRITEVEKYHPEGVHKNVALKLQEANVLMQQINAKLGTFSAFATPALGNKNHPGDYGMAYIKLSNLVSSLKDVIKHKGMNETAAPATDCTWQETLDQIVDDQ